MRTSAGTSAGTESASEQFTSQPLILLSIGPDEGQLWPKLVAAADVPVHPLIDDPTVRFAASSAPGLERVRSGWCWGRHIQASRRPRDPDDAAHTLDLAGLWWNGRSGVLHTGALGVQEIFTRTIGATTYVSNRVSPLANVGPPLDIDWEAWALFLSVNHFSGEDTGFAQIRRVLLSSRLSFTATTTPRAVTNLPSWLRDSGPASSVHDVRDAFLEAVRPGFRERVDLTLSGGFDSRLILAALRRRRSPRVAAWTTHGVAGDFEMAQAVVRGRTQVHTLVDSSVDAWSVNFLPTARQFEHLTSAHTWLQPLSRRVVGRRGPLYDGFGGPLLTRRARSGMPLLDEGWRAATGARWERDDRFLSPQFRSQYGPTLRDKWIRRGDLWSGHPNEVLLRHFITRNNQGVALSPFRLFAPARRVITPIADPPVAAAAIALPPAGDTEINYKRDLLRAIDADLHDLPATGRDTSPVAHFQNPATAPDSLAFLIEVIRREPAALQPLDPGLRLLMDEGDYPMMKWQARMLACAAVLSDWLTTWRPRLNRTDQPWT